MRILFVAIANNIHAARWIGQLRGLGWDLHLFPVAYYDVHPGFRDITVHDMPWKDLYPVHPSVRVEDRIWPVLGRSWPLRRGATQFGRLIGRFVPQWRNDAWRLAQTIRRLKPDVVHSLEMQKAAYLTLEARILFRGTFPPWIYTNWGSDVYLYGRFREHREKIRAVLAACDYYLCESQRDVGLARQFGFQGEVLPVLPGAGSLDLAATEALRQPGPTSRRRVVAVKGHQGWAGRALVAIEALRRCVDLLAGYRVAIYGASPHVPLAGELFSHDTGVPVEIVPRSPHEDILRLHGRARLSIGLSISDGISHSFLDALAMGSFPIQSNTSTAGEWSRDGESVLLVPPEDPDAVAAAFRRALTDDDLVDRASEANAKTAAERLDPAVVRPQVLALYRMAAADRGRPPTENAP